MLRQCVTKLLRRCVAGLSRTMCGGVCDGACKVALAGLLFRSSAAAVFLTGILGLRVHNEGAGMNAQLQAKGTDRRTRTREKSTL
jgi:hypothetical protein